MQARSWLAIAIVTISAGGATLYGLNLNPSKHLPRLKVTQADIDALIDRTYEQMVFVEGGEFLMGDIMRPGVMTTNRPLKYRSIATQLAPMRSAMEILISTPRPMTCPGRWMKIGR